MSEFGHIVSLPVPGRDNSPTNGVANRPDWSPHAQPPDPTTGIMAHTPDPAKYHRSGGATLLPRSKPGRNSHGSRGFDTTPGRVNVVADEDLGGGGFSVDMSKVSAVTLHNAMNQSGGDPSTTLELLSGAVAAAEAAAAQEAVPRVAPLGQGGYVVPAGTKGGAQVTQPANVPAARPHDGLQGTAQNPSVNPPPESPHMSPPIPAQADPSQQQPPEGAAAPPNASHFPNYFPQAPTATPPPQVPAPQLPTQAAPPQLAPAQDSASQLLPMVQHLLEAQLQEIREELKPKDVELEEKSNPELPDVERPACAEDVGFPFLTTPPSKPKVPVIFNLGKGGQHLKRFHHATTHEVWLSLIYDNRYEGDQFIPPVTGEGEDPIEITFPASRNRKVRAIVPASCNMSIGCMDILNFIIQKDSSEDIDPGLPADFLQE